MLNLKLKTSNIKGLIEYLAIIMIILSSGSMFFTIMNVRVTLYALLLVSMITAIVCKVNTGIFKKNILIYAGIAAGVVLNFIFNSQYFVLDNDIFILLIRLTSLLLIQSSVKEDIFIKKYVKILYVLSIVSLICFAYTMLVDYHLPFLIERNKDGINYYYSFYHTVGYRSIYQRNAGIFWEAPAYAVFLSVALIFCMCRSDVFTPNGSVIKYYVVFLATLVSTLSVYAFVYIAIAAGLLLVSSNKNKSAAPDQKGSARAKNRRWYYPVGALLLVAIFIVVESEFQLISYKLIDKQGSFTTRFNDTYYSLMLAGQRLLTGYGIFNNYTVETLRQYGIGNNSNGLAILLMAIGLPMLLVLVWRIGLSLKKMLKVSGLGLLIVMVWVGLFHFSEHLWLFTLFISFIFTWKTPETGYVLKARRQV